MNRKIKLSISIISAIAIIVSAFFVIASSRDKTGQEGYRLQKEKEIYKIGLITDTHMRRSKKNNYDISENSKKFFEHITYHFNNVFNPDIVVENGDFIEGTERRGQKSIDDFLKIKEYFDKIKTAKLHVIGNHETRGLSKEEWLNITKNSKPYYHNDFEKMRLIVLDGNEENSVKKTLGNYYHMSDEQIMWLEETLKNSDGFRYKIIFSHYPILESQITPSSKSINPENLKEINSILKKYKVDAVFSGHDETLKFDKVDETSFFILPGVEKSRIWFDCFYEIYIDKEIKVKMFYKKSSDEKEYHELLIPSAEYEKIEK